MIVVSFVARLHDALSPMLAPGIALRTVDPSDIEALRRELPAAPVLITSQFDARLAPLCGSLKLVISPAAGTEGIDRTALPAGVEIVNGVGHEIPMAEYVIGAIVALRQRFLAGDAALRTGRWRFGFFGEGGFIEEVWGSSIGILGFGRIGVEIAKRAAAFGARSAAVTLHPDKPYDRALLPRGLGNIADARDVDALVAESDAIVCACELSDVTRGLVDARRLSSMKPSAVLVNVARGPIVDEIALYEALRLHRIAAAAIDVWYRYPDGGQRLPASAPFWELDNVLMTPHSSGWTAGAASRKVAFIAGRINEFARS
jgi:phosphoglycerate dehydrogenase-like enzyme